MSNQNNQGVQANFDEVVNTLTQQISQLTVDNAVLKSLVSQYQQQEQQVDTDGNDEQEG